MIQSKNLRITESQWRQALKDASAYEIEGEMPQYLPWHLARHAQGKSRYRGVSWSYRSDRKIDRRPWLASISIQNRRKSLGRFATDVEAAKVYDETARRLFGEQAQVNFPTAEL